MEKFAAGCTYLHEGLCWHLLHWVVHKNRLYTIIDDEEFGEVFSMLHAKMKRSYTNTLMGNNKCAHGMMKEKLIELFKVHLSSPRIAFDVQVCVLESLWQSPPHCSMHGQLEIEEC